MKIAMCLLALAAPASFAPADIVYDSLGSSNPPTNVTLSHDPGETSSTDERAGGFENESQSGQQITLAGTARFVTRIDLYANGFRAGAPGITTPVTYSTTVCLYGILNGLPSQLLWQGDTGVQSLSQAGASAFAPIFVTPNTTLPDTFALELSHTQIQGQAANWFVGNSYQPGAPAVGAASSTVFSQDTATGVWSGSVQSGFVIQARFTAIPAPCSVALLGGGFPALLRRRR